VNHVWDDVIRDYNAEPVGWSGQKKGRSAVAFGYIKLPLSRVWHILM
jgi:hypothetical protein